MCVLLHWDENRGDSCTFFKGVKSNLYSIRQCSTLICVRLRKMSHLVRDIMNEQLRNKACVLWEMSYMGHGKSFFVHKESRLQWQYLFPEVKLFRLTSQAVSSLAWSY